jgi:hypothetical protein
LVFCTKKNLATLLRNGSEEGILFPAQIAAFPALTKTTVPIHSRQHGSKYLGNTIASFTTTTATTELGNTYASFTYIQQQQHQSTYLHIYLLRCRYAIASAFS